MYRSNSEMLQIYRLEGSWKTAVDDIPLGLGRSQKRPGQPADFRNRATFPGHWFVCRWASRILTAERFRSTSTRTYGAVNWRLRRFRKDTPLRFSTHSVTNLCLSKRESAVRSPQITITIVIKTTELSLRF